MTATRDFLESTSNELNQAVIRAKEAVTDEKMLRIATRCQQVLEDAWIKHNAAHALYASKLKEPALKAEAQAIWLGEMRSYEAAMDALEEYLENLQVEPGNAQGDTAVDEDEDVDVDVVEIMKMKEIGIIFPLTITLMTIIITQLSILTFQNQNKLKHQMIIDL